MIYLGVKIEMVKITKNLITTFFCGLPQIIFYSRLCRRNRPEKMEEEGVPVSKYNR